MDIVSVNCGAVSRRASYRVASRNLLLTVALVLLCPLITFGQCALNQSDPSVTICSPTNGSTVTSLVHFVAGSRSSVPVLAMQIYEDDILVYQSREGSIDTFLPISSGPHFIVVKGWQSSGTPFSKSLRIKASNSHTSTSTTATGAGGSSNSSATVTAQGRTDCSGTGASRSVTICAPADGSTMVSPVHVVAAGTSSVAVVAMQVYDNDKLIYSNGSNSIDSYLTMRPGWHYLVVKAWDSSGKDFFTAQRIQVGNSTSPPNSGPAIQLSATPASISPGQNATLSWSITNATSVDIEPGIGKVSSSGSATVMPSSTTTYTARATGPGDNTSASTIITLRPDPPQPRIPEPLPAGPPGSLQSINHVIYMLQENRSFDHYFGHLNAYRQMQGLPAEVDGLPSGAQNLSFDGTANIQAFHMNSVCQLDLSSAWNESHVSFNRNNPASNTGLNDGFAYTAGKFARDNGYWDVEGQRTMGYYDWTQLPYYYFMATQFAISDRWFSPAPTRTAPNRYYAVSATSVGHAYPATSGLTNPTIFDELQQAGISWKVYEGTSGDTILGDWQGFVSKYGSHFVDASQFATDAANGTLPAVALIEQKQNLDEHPGNDIQQGSAYVASLINALMNSQSWKDSVFIITWDEAGNFYDHVPSPPAQSPDGIPPQDLASTDIQGDFTRYGFRVPNIVISPFTKTHYVSHTVMDTTAILKLIETRFNLPSLTARDGNSPDMTEFFDFQDVPWRTPPSPPAQPTNAPCYYDHLP